MTAFTFGENWLRYSRLIDEERVRAAEQSVRALLGRADLEGWSVLDVGCGSGLFSIACARLGARSVVAIDRDPNSLEAARRNIERFLDSEGRGRVDIRAGDILNPDRDCQPFDLVYAWGSLHHTGAMWQAIENAAMFCRSGGYFVVAIYNRTRFSPSWLRIKRLYHRSPSPVRFAMAGALSVARAVVRVARFRHPFTTERGMNVWYDAIDWLGGLPYEYATPNEIRAFMERRGNALERSFLTSRLGCNEFVFRKTASDESVARKRSS